VRLDGLLFDDGDGDALAVHAGGRDHTRAEVRVHADALAGALSDAGVARGTAVAVMLPDGADVVAALFGVWRAGAVYVPLNPRYAAHEVDHVLAAVEPAAVVTTPDRVDGFAGRPLAVLHPPNWPGNPSAGVGVPGPERVVGGGGPPVRRYGDDVALVQLTSGTTGRPKPVLLEHHGVLELIDGVLTKLRGGKAPRSDRPPMPNLVPVSLSQWAGIYQVLFALRAGSPVVVMEGFETRAFAELVRRFDIRSTVLPPAAMAMLADDEGIEDLAPLRFVRSITAPLSPLQARRFRDRFGISVLNSYGQTEIGGEIVGWSAADSREHGDDKLGSVGRPHAGVEVRVVDEAGSDVAPGEVGELWVRTPAMSAGYADGSDLSERLSPDGFFRTGDVGRVDADGFVWIEGRVSDMVNRGGLKVFPAEVEEVLRLLPEVHDAAVVGMPDDRLGEVPVAFVVGEPLEDEALVAHCRAHLAPYKVPVAFHRSAGLPRNEVGKVLKAELARSAAEQSTG
jgi:long-chain acyl-CoA synthetase